MERYKKNSCWVRLLLKCFVLIALLTTSQQAEATLITYYNSEHCEICKAFDPAWDEFVANESNNYTIMKKSIMDADNLQELTQLSQTLRERVVPKTPSIYIEFDDKPPVLLISSKEIGSLYQVLEPGTTKTLNFVVPVQVIPQLTISSYFMPVTFAAAADAVNPCAIFVFILAVSYATIYSGRRKAIVYGGTFAAALYLTYFTAGLAGKVVISKIFSNANTIALIMSGSLFIIAGFHIRTVLYPQKTNISELSDAVKSRLIKYAEKCTSVGGAATSGALCAMIELPCTGGPYAFALSLLAKQSMVMTALWLGYYNLIFISPILMLLFILIVSPEKVDRLEELRNKHKRLLHLAMALCLTAAGTWGLWHYY